MERLKSEDVTRDRSRHGCQGRWNLSRGKVPSLRDKRAPFDPPEGRPDFFLGEAGPQANLFNAQFGGWFLWRQNFVAESPDFSSGEGSSLWKAELPHIIQWFEK